MKNLKNKNNKLKKNQKIPQKISIKKQIKSQICKNKIKFYKQK